MQTQLQQVLSQLNQVILGKQHETKLALSCLLARGHLLIEDLPGMGKTTLAHALATTMGLDYQRVQFTADMLPADLLGMAMPDPQQQFVFHPGPIFTQVLLADEINRGSPRTQSALLEAMAEQQVSIEQETRPLPDPFFVIATQNPLEQTGTYPLPESQLDRFLMRISLGYPDRQTERKMLLDGPRPQVQAVLNATQLIALQDAVAEVHAADAALDYLLALVDASRKSGLSPHALSPRASKALLAAARGWAFLHQRDYLIPDDIQAIFPAVAEHRLRNNQRNMANQPASYSQALLEQVEPLA